MANTETGEKQINIRISKQLYDALVKRQREEEKKTLIKSTPSAVARAILAKSLTR